MRRRRAVGFGRLTGPPLDRLTDHAHIIETIRESCLLNRSGQTAAMPRPAGRLLCSGPVVHDMPTLDTETEMTPSISIPGMCNICGKTLPGN